jgi:hypothetical protein
MHAIILAAITALITAGASIVGATVTIRIKNRSKEKEYKKEIQQLKAENDELKKIKEAFMNGPLSLKDGIYFDESGNPYCAACFGSVYNRTPLKKVNKSGNWTLYVCPKCNAHYEQGEHSEQGAHHRGQSWNPFERK